MPEYSEKKPSCTLLLIWDAEGEPPDGDWTPVLWREFVSNAQSDAVSIPAIIEANADLLINMKICNKYGKNIDQRVLLY